MRSVLVVLLLLAASCLFGETRDLERLIEGNKRYMKDDLLHPNRTFERRQATVSEQNPFAVIVSCSDSRVSPEIIFDQGIGDLFIVRLAGNVIGPLARESIEFAVHHLRTPIVLVLGHENCGAVKAVIQGQTQDVPELAALISPSVKTNGKDSLEAAIKANAIKMKNTLEQHQDFKPLLEKGKLKLYAGYYHLESGKVEILK